MGDMADDAYDAVMWEDDEPDGIPCPRCQGDGTVDCHCGGDLCVCENYGERDCPVCGGDGEVSEAVEAEYLKSRSEMHEAMRRVFKDHDQ